MKSEHIDRHLLESKPAAMRPVEPSKSTVFFTYHTESTCLDSTFFDTQIPSYIDRQGRKQDLKLNRCLHVQKFNAKFACKVGKNKYTLVRKVYAESDLTCSAPISTQATEIYKHDYVCSRDKSGNTDAYLQIHCGEDTLLETTMPAMPYVLYPEVYTNSRCSSAGLKSYDVDTPPTTKRHWLDVCTGHYTTPKMPEGSIAFAVKPYLAYHYIISAVTTNPLKLKVTRFAPTDPKCTTKKYERVYSYPDAPAASNVMPACVPDAINSEFAKYYYFNTDSSMPRAVNVMSEGSIPRFLQVKLFSTSDTTCSGAPYAILFKSLHERCVKGMNGLMPTGKSEKSVYSSTGLTSYSYNDSSCSGPSTSTFFSSSQMTSMHKPGQCSIDGSQYEFLTELPQTNYNGRIVYSFSSIPGECKEGTKWNSAAVFVAGSCIPSTSSDTGVSVGLKFDCASSNSYTYEYYNNSACAFPPSFRHTQPLSTQCFNSQDYISARNSRNDTDDTGYFTRERCGSLLVNGKSDALTSNTESTPSAPILGGSTPAKGFLLTSYFNSPGCMTKPFWTDVEIIGACIQETQGERPLGTSYRKRVGSNSYETYHYTTGNCDGTYTKDTSSLTSLSLDVCQSTTYSRRVSFVTTLPSTIGTISRYYASDSTCTQGGNATYVGVYHDCLPSSMIYGVNGDYKWSAVQYIQQGSCSADGKTAKYYSYADAQCSTRNASSTFVGDTGGAASTTLTIRGIRCSNEDNNLLRCDHTRGYPSGPFLSTAAGTSGGILLGMALSWPGKDLLSPVVKIETCSFNWTNPNPTDADTAVCTLTSSVNIPPNSTITGKYTFPSTVTYEETYNNKCSYLQSSSSQDNTKAWKRSSCGNLNDAVGLTVLESNRVNIVTYNGYVYSTVADVSVNGPCCTSQAARLQVPAGWRVAPNTTEIIQNVIKPYTWSTCNLYVGIKDNSGNKGFAYRTKVDPADGSCSDTARWSDWKAITDQKLLEIGQFTNSQLLIRKCTAGTYSDGAWNSDATVCQVCPVGKTTETAGAFTSAACK